MLQARDWFWEDKSVPKEYFLVVSLVVHRQLSLVLKLKSAPISLNLSKPAHDQVQKYTVLMMNTQAVMMIVVILANLLLLLTGLKRCEYFFLRRNSQFWFIQTVSINWWNCKKSSWLWRVRMRKLIHHPHTKRLLSRREWFCSHLG